MIFAKRTGKRVDANHADIRDGLKRIPGMVVRDLTQSGGPLDLLCSYKGRLMFLEVKDGSLKPSARKLTEKEEDFIAKFSEFCAVVLSLDDALRAMGVT
jgi:hypothetical protein